jgi:ATP/maltotriose-dependent transcriptional regulator MalT
MASVISLMEATARAQKETAEILRNLAARSRNAAATRRLRRAEDAIQELASFHNGPSPQPEGKERWRKGQGQPDSLPEPLTPREETVLWLLTGELSQSEIGQEIYVSRNTVKSHLRAIYRKLGVSSRHEAVRRARALAILPS